MVWGELNQTEWVSLICCVGVFYLCPNLWGSGKWQQCFFKRATWTLCKISGSWLLRWNEISRPMRFYPNWKKKMLLMCFGLCLVQLVENLGYLLSLKAHQFLPFFVSRQEAYLCLGCVLKRRLGFLRIENKLLGYFF